MSSFEFWAIIEDSKLDDDMYGIGIINGIHAATLDQIHEELKHYILDLIDRFPSHSVVDFIAENVCHEGGQMSFPETGQWDFPPHYSMDIKVVKVKEYEKESGNLVS
jgi:hypothetical protein